jgi:hypothetical protein
MCIDRRMRYLVAALILGLTASAARAAAPRLIRNEGRGFSLMVPDGYVDAPNTSPLPRTLHTFARGQPGEPGSAAIVVQDMGGTIGREPLIHAMVERAARDSLKPTGFEVTSFEYRKLPWKSFELEAVLTTAGGADRSLLSVSVQVPLAGSAIQIIVAGAPGDKERLVADLQALLGSLDGKSSWLSDSERSRQLGRAAGQLAILAAAVGLIVWLARRRRRQA